MIISDYICSQINLPMCPYISKTACIDKCRAFFIGSAKLNSAVNTLMIVTTVLLTFKMINHVRNLCSSIGRQEMSTLFYLYILSATTEAFLLMKGDASGVLGFLTTLLHISLANTTYFSLMLGGITIDVFIGKWGMRSETILYFFTMIYFVFNLFIVAFGMFLKESFTILLMTFVFNGVFVFVYFVTQIRKLNRNKGEVWAYGTLGIALAFFLVACVPIFIGGRLTAILSDKYIDNLFFHNIFVFCSLIMIHKYWLSTCDYEVECLLLDV